MKYTIIDNFLNVEDFNLIKSKMMGNYFPWFYNDMKTDYLESQYNFQFTHLFYDNFKPNSPFFDIVTPLIQKINPAAILRIKANLTPVTDTKIIYDYHLDYSDVNCKTAVFYLNTNNGETLFQSGERVSSIENRFISFDSNNPHTGTSCTNEKVRCVININYFEYV
jgi:hypothetical protein